MMARWRRLGGKTDHFRSQEDGAATVLGLISGVLLLLMAAIAVDMASIYRQRALLQITADSASQAGVVALARGESLTEIRRKMRDIIELNLPETRFGKLITNPVSEVQALHYDPETGRIGSADIDNQANAILVRLQRSEAAGNPLSSFLTGVGDEGWSLAATSVAVLAPTQRCGNGEAIVARGPLDLGDAPRIGPGFCLHSQTAITLPIGTQTTDPLRISLPNLAGCEGVCGSLTATDLFPSDTRPVALNLVMPQAQDHVARLVTGFLNPDLTLPEETSFFATRPLDGDPEALREVGLKVSNIRPGDVLKLTPLQFSRLRDRPTGLVYDVRCNTIENDPRPVWEWTLPIIGDDFGPTLRNLVLITDCAIEMDDLVRVEGALLLLTGPGERALSALPGATLGDPKQSCNPALRTRVMKLGDLAVTPEMAHSNVSIVAGGSVRLESDPDRPVVPHVGLVLHAGGKVSAAGSHSFERCPAEATDDPLMPPMQIIAHTMPPLGGVLAPPVKARPKTPLPGQEVDRLSMLGTRKSGS